MFDNNIFATNLLNDFESEYFILRPVSIRRRESIVNELGELSGDYGNVYKVDMFIEPITDSSKELAPGQVEVQKWRAYSAVDEKLAVSDRVTFKDIEYEIESIMEHYNYKESILRKL